MPRDEVSQLIRSFCCGLIEAAQVVECHVGGYPGHAERGRWQLPASEFDGWVRLELNLQQRPPERKNFLCHPAECNVFQSFTVSIGRASYARSGGSGVVAPLADSASMASATSKANFAVAASPVCSGYAMKPASAIPAKNSRFVRPDEGLGHSGSGLV